MHSSEDQRFGSAAIIGLPNSGKSTLTNALIGAKISIVSKKIQTTRCRINGIFIHDRAQIVLVDTPGIFSPKKNLDKAMVQAAFDAIAETDIILHIVDVSRKNILGKNKNLVEQFSSGKKIFLVSNKIDQIDKKELLKIVGDFNKLYPYERSFMISALKKNGLDALKKEIAMAMPLGPWCFDPDDLTDMPMRFIAAEITREKIFHQLHEELPYSIFVETENWENFDNGSIKIAQVVTVEKESQKAIVLGKSGSRIKAVGEASRLELEQLLNQRVHLKLFVKVERDWAEKTGNFQKIGLHFKK